jgi:hypothetical protein
MVQDAGEEGGDRGDVVEQRAPVLHGAVGGQDRGRPLVAAYDELLQVVGGGGWQLPHSQAVDDQVGGPVLSSVNTALRMPSSVASVTSSSRLPSTARWCRRLAPARKAHRPSRIAQRHAEVSRAAILPGGPEVVAYRFPADARFLFNRPEEPGQQAEGADLLLLGRVHDTAHGGERPQGGVLPTPPLA